MNTTNISSTTKNYGSKYTHVVIVTSAGTERVSSQHKTEAAAIKMAAELNARAARSGSSNTFSVRAK